MKRLRLEVIIPVVALPVFLLLWETYILVTGISPLILPSPRQVASALFVYFPVLATNGLITLGEAVGGFLIGGVLAVFLASVFQFSKTVKQAIYPYVVAIRAIPLIALAPLVIIWMGTGYLSKVALAAIISFFPILVNMMQGLGSVEEDALDILATFSATPWQIFTKVRFCTALPHLFSGMKVSSSFAVIGALVAEFTGANDGIGYVIKSSSYYADTDLTFAAIFIASVIGLLFFGAVVLLEKKILFWDQNGNSV